MVKNLERYIQERNFYAPDDELRTLCPTSIGIFYAFNTYSCSLEHIKELAEAVRKEYPTLRDDQMNIWYVERSQSIRHACLTTLYVSIPIEDFIRMRQNNEIRIL